MEPFDIGFANFVLNAIQVGGLVGFMTLALLAFVKGWIYAKHVVDDYKKHIQELTAALKSANEGMERMADAWEARNQLEREARDWDRRARER